MVLDAKVELLITSLGSPRTVVNEAKSVGAKVFCDVTTLKHANIVAKAGADALIAVAQGAGGHAGNISPFSLYPYLKKKQVYQLSRRVQFLAVHRCWPLFR